MVPDLPSAALRLEIDADALQANWQSLNRLSGAAAAGAAVKADAYGIGVRRAVPILRDAGCRDFFVAHWSEVPAVAEHVEPARISVLHGPRNGDEAGFALAIGAKPVINSRIQARLWREAGGGTCDVMVDTGINRLGMALEDLSDTDVQALEVDVLMSHLASADEDVDLNECQLGRWNDARSRLRHKRSSLANSAGIVLGDAYHGELTRPGLSLYGGIPRPELEGKIRQVVTPQAAVMQIRSLSAGDGVGYNSTFVADREMRVGTIALGYADGYLRCWSGKGFLTHDARRLPVLGRVSMDMTVLDLTDAPEVREGDWMSAEYHLPSAAAASGLSQYELLTLLGQRFAR